MVEWFWQAWQSLTWSRIIIGSLFVVLSAVISYVVIILVMIKLPADYFSPNYAKNQQSNPNFMLRWGATIFKNLIGFLLVLVGIAMIFGPGPGALTILLGIIMMDIPGKRPLEARFIQQPTILNSINKLRSRYKKPPLIMD